MNYPFNGAVRSTMWFSSSCNDISTLWGRNNTEIVKMGLFLDHSMTPQSYLIIPTNTYVSYFEGVSKVDSRVDDPIRQSGLSM